MGRFVWFAALWVLVALSGRAQAQDADAARTRATLVLNFVPTHRAQIAVWVEKTDGTFMGTLALTHATSTLGIGNRPGALQMNSGFRWPYGRREGVLPVWAHRRAAAPGAKQWKRVIFQDRVEGFASRTSNDQSADDYYCLSFQKTASSKDALDAVTCASVFSSDKGRFITMADVRRGYAEPFEDDALLGPMRPLELTSLYPPRRDISRCTSSGCYDSPDVSQYRSHALEVMPELDAIARATPQGEQATEWTFSVPESWDHGDDYVMFLEANVEGDYNERFDDSTYHTPCNDEALCGLDPDDPRRPACCKRWDMWARTFGYPYRGQPSVVYQIPFRLDATRPMTMIEPIGRGALHGETGDITPLDGDITDAPGQAPGSGADRLRARNNVRATLAVSQLDPCGTANPPPECGKSCANGGQDCGDLVCDEASGTCMGYCVSTEPIGAMLDLKLSRYPDDLHAHMWATLSFRIPESQRRIGSFDVRVKAEGGEWDQAFTYDREQQLLPVALDLCADPDDPMVNRCKTLTSGSRIEAVLAGLRQATRYTVEVAARDEMCQERGDVVTATFSTPERAFSTVSPCFVATAAYGTPMAKEIGVLRKVRDRYLAPSALGRAFIRTYYRVGPEAAEVIAQHAWLRSVTRAILSPLVAVAAWWMD